LPTEPQDRLEALAAELACVEGPAELVEARTLLLEHLTARGLNQDQVPRTPFAVSEPNEPFTLTGVETRERHDDALTCPESLQDRYIEQLARPRLDLVCPDPTGKQSVDPR